MEIEKIAAELSEIEAKTLSVLADGGERNAGLVNRESGLNIDSVRRAFSWLEEKGLIEVKEQREKIFQLTTEGKKALVKGLPEKVLLQTLLGMGEKSFLGELREKSGLNEKEFSAALGENKRKEFIAFVFNTEGEKKIVLLTDTAKEFFKEKTSEEKVLEKINKNLHLFEEEKIVFGKLLRRGLVEEKETVQRTAKISAQGKKALEIAQKTTQRAFNVAAPVPEIFIGKKQPYVQFLGAIRRRLAAMGFKEMPERLVTQEFYNFDVLFQPQNHPARSWTESYQLKHPSHGKLPGKKIVERVRAAHEHGSIAGSKGWGYKWSEEIASRLMPSAHGTAADARQMVEGVEEERKYFVINRVFRPDVLDAKHLIEFNQLDGFVVGRGLNFRNLLFMLKELAMEIAGAKQVKFFPDYYPFTEPSVQLSALHPEMGWVEFAGAGIFRPEITENLGIKEPVIAWGMGIDRLAMFRLGIHDIRMLFSDDLNWLRNAKMVVE